MSETVVSASGVERGGAQPPSWWPVARWSVLALSVLTVAVFAVQGHLQASYGDLQQEVRQGTVTEVRIEGGLGGADGIDPGVQGVAVVHVYWDTGWPSRVTRIWQATSQSELNSDTLAGADAEAVVVGPVDDALRLESPGLVVAFSEPPEPSAGAILGRWELPDSWMALPFVLLAGFFLVLGRGPEPRWATRWAWVWLSLTPVMVLVVPLYVLFGARPHPSGARRLTGGWAFLITLIVFSGLGVLAPI